MNYTLDVAKIEIKDLEDTNLVEVVENGAKKSLSKIIGNMLFSFASSIELSDKAREIHAEKPVKLNDTEKAEIEALINKNLNYAPIIARSICASIQPVANDPIDELEVPLMNN